VGLSVLALPVGLLLGTAPPAQAAAGESIAGTGHFTLDEPGIEGHRIRFTVQARAEGTGTARRPGPSGSGTCSPTACCWRPVEPT
jgi:hypothetical protein